ncbi:hypothetical protein QQ045_026459 [Rhodiola kirilowii]
MIQLLLAVVFFEMVLIIALLFKTPFRPLVIMGMDNVKRGRGPVVVKTVGGTVFVVLLSTLQGMAAIQDNVLDGGLVNPTDQVLMATYMLQASLMGEVSALKIKIKHQANAETLKAQSEEFLDGYMDMKASNQNLGDRLHHSDQGLLHQYIRELSS